MPLVAEQLRFTYPKTDFSLYAAQFQLGAGECVALRGSNGSGKTTLGKLAAGLLKPGEGRVLLDGEDTADWPLGRVGARVGYLFQEPSRQIFAPIVQEDLTFVPVLQGMPQDQADARAAQMMERFELISLARRSVYTLSRGEKQRLAICGMLLSGPSYMVLDEPTTGLDGRRRDILAAMLEELREDGIGILLISHDDNFCARVSSRVLCMEGGVLYE